jgi:hypothetical protein
VLFLNGYKNANTVDLVLNRTLAWDEKTVKAADGRFLPASNNDTP